MRSFTNITGAMAKAILFASIYRRVRTRRTSSFGGANSRSTIFEAGPRLSGARRFQANFAARGPCQNRLDAPGDLAAALLLIIAAGSWGLQEWNSGPSLPDKPSIAVLPFDNIGDDPQWARFADGITEDIITDLSHSKDLIVIARNSTEVYKGKPVDIRQIGGDLRREICSRGQHPVDGRANSRDRPARRSRLRQPRMV